MDILERLEASPLGAAARRLTYEPVPETPDDMGVPPTVPAAAEDAGANRRAPSAEPDSPDLVEMRRDLDSVTAQLGNLTALMQAVYEQQQQQLQQNDRQTEQMNDRPTARPTARQNERMTEPNDLQQQQQQQRQEYDPQQQQQQQQRDDRPTDEQMNDQPTDENDSQQQYQQQQNERYEGARWQQDQEQQVTDERQYDRATAAAAAAAAAVSESEHTQNRGQLETGDSAEQGTGVCLLKCPISALQSRQWHAAHSPAQQCTTDKRWTTNCTNTWDHIAKVRPSMTAAFITGVSVPGSEAADAVEEFESEVTPWLETDGTVPAQHLVAGLVIEGFKRASAAVSEDAKALVYCSVLRSGELREMLAEIKQTGEYDMEESESEVRAGELPGFQNFDPLTTAGSDNWRLVKEILVAYGSQSMNAALDEQEAKRLWEGIEITNVREFTALERKAFKVWKRAGGTISDQTRIEDIKQRFSLQMDAAYKAYVLSEDTHGRHDPQLEKQWGKFKLVFRRVGQAVQRSGGGAGVEAADKRQRNMMPVRRAANSTESEQQLRQMKDLCFEHSKLGSCSYGAECRWNHAGAPGALKHLVVDANGDCIQFKKYGNCRRLDRGRCTFQHNPAAAGSQLQQRAPAAPAQNTTAVMSAEQHEQIMDYAEAAGKDPSTVTLEEAQAARTPAAARNVFTVLHQDKAEKVRKMRPKAVAAIQWKRWTKENDDFDDEEEEDYYDQ
jgi:hypothetical protein